MPYRASGVWVLIERRGRWVNYKKHKSKRAAKAQATALNMRHAGIPKQKPKK